jgi:hypothetical protein
MQKNVKDRYGKEKGKTKRFFKISKWDCILIRLYSSILLVFGHEVFNYSKKYIDSNF